MRKWTFPALGALLLAAACGTESGEGEVSPITPVDSASAAAFRAHVAKVEAALGTFHDIRVFDRPAGSREWQLLAGQYVPVTVDGHAPERYYDNMKSDRPMMLPTRVEGAERTDGQSTPYSAVGRMPGSNPEVQWVWVVRQYEIKDPSDPGFVNSPDMAVIGHHPRTGATAFFQYYDPARPKSGRVVVAPFSEDGPSFWSPIEVIADSFACQRCHDAGPFIHSPWIDQVRVAEYVPGQPVPEPIVPSDPLGPYFFIDAGEGERFAWWNHALEHFDKPDNGCTQCHRIGNDMIGLNQNSTKYYGLSPTQHNRWSVQSDSFQTPEYHDIRWMPPVGMPITDHYGGQWTIQDSVVGVWEMNFGPSAHEVNQVTADTLAWNDARSAGIVKPNPAPPEEYRTILVDRPEQDRVAPGATVWIVDTRMKANTDGDLHQWRFFGKETGGADVQAAPVVYRRRAGDGMTVEFEVVYVGEPRSADHGGDWVFLEDSEDTFDVRLGDYFGVVFTNGSGSPGAAPVPYTEDDWAELKWPDGTTRYLNGFGHWQGYVTLKLTTDTAPAAGQRLLFQDADYRTYSFELQNRL